MKLTISQPAFAAVLAKGCSAIAKVSIVPILRHARLVADSGTLRVATCDLVMQAESASVAEIEQDGATTVDAARLKAAVDKLPSSAAISLALSDDGKELIVKAGRSRIRMPTLPVEDFPALDGKTGTDTVAFELSGPDLDRLLARPLTSAGQNHQLTAFNAVYMHVREWSGRQALCAIGTDALIMMLTAIDAPTGADGMPKKFGPSPGVLLDPGVTATILRLFKSAKSVRITVGSSKIILGSDSDVLSAKLVDAVYPDYARIMSAEPVGTIVVDRDDALRGASLVETFIDQGSGTRIEMAPQADGGLMMATASAGDSRTIVDAEAKGEVQFFAMKCAHIKAVLSAFKSDTVTLELGSAVSERGKPVVFKTAAEPDFVSLIALIATSGQWVSQEAPDGLAAA